MQNQNIKLLKYTRMFQNMPIMSTPERVELYTNCSVAITLQKMALILSTELKKAQLKRVIIIILDSSNLLPE